jgi:hypothetical protein
MGYLEDHKTVGVYYPLKAANQTKGFHVKAVKRKNMICLETNREHKPLGLGLRLSDSRDEFTGRWRSRNFDPRVVLWVFKLLHRQEARLEGSIALGWCYNPKNRIRQGKQNINIL